MKDTDIKSHGWKAKLAHEFVSYLVNFAYLAVFFSVFAWHRRLILAEHNIPITDFGMPIVEAAILAKVVLILDMLKLGRRFENRPLIVPMLYKAVVFGIGIALFGFLEAGVRGMVHGQGMVGGINELMRTGRDELLSRILVMFFALLPFFAFGEIGRAMGKGKLTALFWTNGAPREN